ncbi:hypothetical protein T484DRAFT_1787673 [Baffinella frigidus]|nr:hypothetical protein T484DRAFT_1787673 [Cryptophyta sp. CCMP2293]
MEYDPRSQAMDMLKALCLLSTIITLLVTYRLYILSELFERLVAVTFSARLLDLCLLSTIITLLITYRLYILSELFERLVAHLTQLMTLDEHIPLYHPLSNSDFWMEVLIILPVCPPFFTAEIGIINWDNFVLYRIETVLAMWSTIRFYRGWQSIRDYVLVKLPKRHTVAAFDHLSLGSAYAFKVLMKGPFIIVMMKGNYAAPFIIVLWGFSICLSSYWFRLSESTACLFKFVEDPRCEDENAKIWGLGNTAHTFEKKNSSVRSSEEARSTPPAPGPSVNDPWIWNAMWIMWATASSVGYGDFAPTTHAGRVIAV